LSLGYIGVAFFFTLSGFVLAWGTEPSLRARVFYRRRIARVWPSHAVMLFVAAVLPVVAVARGPLQAVTSLLLVQAWWPQTSVAYGMNGVSWSLSCEFFFYAIFPLVMPLLRRWRRRTGLLLVGAALAFEVAISLIAPGFAFHLPVARFGEFLLGAVAGLAMRDGWRPRIPIAGAVALVGAGLAVSPFLPFPLPDVVMVGPFLIVLLVAGDRDLRKVPGILRDRRLVFAGEASFAFYLVHELAIINLRPHLHGAPWMRAVAITCVCCVAAVALHVLVERPLAKVLRGGVRSIALAPADDLVPETPSGERPGTARRLGHESDPMDTRPWQQPLERDERTKE